MNKKIIVLIVGVIIVTAGVVFLAISSNKSKTADNLDNNIVENENSNEIQDENTNDNDKGTLTDKKVAIIYFSATGTTKKIAEYIKNTTNGDLIEIIPKEKYTDKDLNYGNDDSRANKEQNDSKARPEIKNNITTDDYDVI